MTAVCWRMNKCRVRAAGGAVIFGAVERDQHVIAQPAEGCEPATSFQRFDRSGKQRVFRRYGSSTPPLGWDVLNPPFRIVWQKDNVIRH
jgi:hypothetical protein